MSLVAYLVFKDRSESIKSRSLLLCLAPVLEAVGHLSEGCSVANDFTMAGVQFRDIGIEGTLTGCFHSSLILIFAESVEFAFSLSLVRDEISVDASINGSH